MRLKDIIILCVCALCLQLNHQLPTRPVVLLAWTVAGRIAAKVGHVLHTVSVCVSRPLPGGDNYSHILANKDIKSPLGVRIFCLLCV